MVSANFLPYPDTLKMKPTDNKGAAASKKNSVNKTDIKYPIQNFKFCPLSFSTMNSIIPAEFYYPNYSEIIQRVVVNPLQ